MKKYIEIREILFKNWKWLFKNTNQTRPIFFEKNIFLNNITFIFTYFFIHTYFYPYFQIIKRKILSRYTIHIITQKESYSWGREEIEKIGRFEAASWPNEPNLFSETNTQHRNCTYNVTRHVAVNPILHCLSSFAVLRSLQPTWLTI